jgi:hypothetical protein
VRPLLRRVHERVGARDELAGDRQGELRPLARLERADLGLNLQREEPLGPLLLADDRPFNPLSQASL